ncbi:tctex1 domain-containing protein 2-like [Asterias rubens]|uniref:tctex1 domain-containing protein 2-like n=1 Tax=Asterias rubens TaxID=7604 RepID=UPI0014555C9A|nr:tctex1 domain-containing protein 2-like [Asterias rubens]
MDGQRKMQNITETTPRGSPSPRLNVPGQLSGGNTKLQPGPNGGRGTTVTRKFSLAPSNAPSTGKQSSVATHSPGIQIDNTFQMEPDPDYHFNASRVEKLLKKLTESMLDGIAYDRNTTPDLARNLSEDVKNRVKQLKYDRYKIAVHVIIGSVDGQGMKIVSRSVWDDQLDNYASTFYQSSTLFAVVMVHATYYE